MDLLNVLGLCFFAAARTAHGYIHITCTTHPQEMDLAIFGDKLFTTDGDGNDISVEILRTICNDDAALNPLYGESLQSSSPADISL